MDLRFELQTAERAALAAGELIAAHYARGPIAVETKADDSPVTQADRDANAKILEVLGEAFPEDAILSEETPDDHARLARRRVWIVDPLDGTRDFVARTGQFSVHVGLAVDGEAVVGVVYQPVTGALFSAARGMGAFRVEGTSGSQLRVSTVSELAALRIGVSRLNLSDRLKRCLHASGLERTVPMGASVKHTALAAGELDAVINLSAGELEWDTCAPEVVIREAGGVVTDGEGRPFRYNQVDLVHHRGSICSNGKAHAALVAAVQPYLT